VTSSNASDLAGRRIRDARQRRGWSAKELAERCAEAGAPHITPTVITNLETRRRATREITLDEVLIIAAVLDVPPLKLILPVDPGEGLEVVPGVHLDELAAVDWIVGTPEQVRLDDIRSPEPDAAAPLERWEERVAHMVGREVRRNRDRRKLGTQQLADRTAEFGMPIPRNVLANLESGRRDMITVSEVLVLAAALCVSPLELVAPVGYDAEIELLPGRKMDPLQASRWVDGQLVLDATGPTTDFRLPSQAEGSGIALVERHAAVLDQVHQHEAEVIRSERDLDAARTNADMITAAALDAAEHDKDPETAAMLRAEAEKHRRTQAAAMAELHYRVTSAEAYQAVAIQSLRFIRAEMRHRGMILPPLPPSLKDEADAPEGSAE
jgi:transcriptional regulator with XRE-family HTH domain